MSNPKNQHHRFIHFFAAFGEGFNKAVVTNQSDGK